MAVWSTRFRPPPPSIPKFECSRGRGPSSGNALTGRCCRDAWRSCALLEGTLLALGTLCMEREESRKQLMEAKVLGQIVRALDNQLAGGRPTREIMHVTFV